MAALRCSTADKIFGANVENVDANLARGADSIPKSSQAVRSAPADLPPMRFTWIPRSDVNERGTIVPRRCDGRPKDQRLCPQTEPKGG